MRCLLLSGVVHAFFVAPRVVPTRHVVWSLSRPEAGGPVREWIPLSYRSDNGTRDSEFNIEDETNKYYELVAMLSPKEIIGRFAEMAPKRVQDAVRATIYGLLGNAGSFAVETTTQTTSERLANLMFQLQMTGYMFKNAEYRMSLTKSLPAPQADALPMIRGTIKVRVGDNEVAVDADEYMAELRDEVIELRRELAAGQDLEKRDLIAYIRAMPEQQMSTLTSDITQDVLDAMKKLVYSIMRGIAAPEVEPGLVLTQSGPAMAQLIMWQLVIGYNLRDLELRDLAENKTPSSNLTPATPPNFALDTFLPPEATTNSPEIASNAD